MFAAAANNPNVVSTKFWELVVSTLRASAGIATYHDTPSMPLLPPPKCFAALLTGVEAEAQNVRDACFHGVCLLEWVYAAQVDDSSSVKANGCWRYMHCLSHPDFVPLLKRRHPRALTLLACCIAIEISAKLQTMWWMVTNTVPTVKALSDLVPRPRNPLMEWALAVSKGEIELSLSPNVWLPLQRGWQSRGFVTIAQVCS